MARSSSSREPSSQAAPGLKERGRYTWLVFFGVDLPREKRIEIGLTYIYGIGNTTAKKIVAETGVNPDIRVVDISKTHLPRRSANTSTRTSPSKVTCTRGFAEHQAPDGDWLLRGLRHRKGLPVRGQRTHTNARTRKGPRKQIGGKKK